MTDPFLFVVGAGRSGTTLLAALLDSHPSLSVPGESGGFIFRLCIGEGAWDPHKTANDDPAQALAGSSRSDHPYDREAVRELVGRLSAEHRYRLWGLDDDQLLEFAMARGINSRADFIRSAYADFAHAHGKTRYGDKTPDHVVYLRTLGALFPEAIFVHLIRDGRDVALALRDTSWGIKDTAEAARYWAGLVNTGSQSGAELGPERYLEVYYEALVKDPEPELRRLCEFATLDYEPAMLRHDEAAGRQLTMSPIPSEDKSLLRPITSGLRDWRKQMSQPDIETFDAVAGDTLRRFGY